MKKEPQTAPVLFCELGLGDLFQWKHLTGLKTGPKSAVVNYQGRDSSMMLPGHTEITPIND